GALSVAGNAVSDGGPTAAVFLSKYEACSALPMGEGRHARSPDKAKRPHPGRLPARSAYPATNHQSPITNHVSPITLLRHFQRQGFLDLFHDDVALGLAHMRQGEQAAAQQLAVGGHLRDARLDQVVE